MSKLPKKHRFLDLSDYGRPAAKLIATGLKNTKVTPIHVTWAFIICGVLAIYAIIKGNFAIAAILLILKSVLDAADGELARIKNTPSFTGRYFDSIADIVLNFLIIFTIAYIIDAHYILAFIAFLGIQLQGTLYNYYYVILRTKLHGDTTSRIFEDTVPTALKGESQKSVNRLYYLYRLLYKYFDLAIFKLDKTAVKSNIFPNWFMTLVSLMGLGTQLLIISVLLVMGLIEYVIPFFIIYTLMIFVLIAIRKSL